jgi:MYXO-CTERM domain-containing protein
MNPGALQAFTTTGGVPPVQWNVLYDSSCNSKSICSRAESISATVGIFQAGPADGTATIAGIDSKGAEVRATISVAGIAVDGGSFPPAWDGSIPDAHPDGGSGKEAGADAAGTDASGMEASSTPEGSSPMEASAGAPPPVEIGNESPDRQGCSCRTAGNWSEGGRGGGLAGLLLAFAFARRRGREK